MRLFAKIFEHADFGGKYRWITDDVEYFISNIGFNDVVSSIKIYKGNDYQPGDFMRFYKDRQYSGGYLDLGPGSFPNIHISPYSFGDNISSVQICPASITGKPMDDIPVRLIVRLYQDEDFKGQYRDLVESEASLDQLAFNNMVTSFRVVAGEDYEPGWVCTFYRSINYSGGMLDNQLQGGRGNCNFGPGDEMKTLGWGQGLNDDICSVLFHKVGA